MDVRNLALEGGQPGEIVFHAADGGRTYTRVFLPPRRLILLGGGHISHALCRYAADLDFDVTVVDDRPLYANEARFPDAKGIVCRGFDEAVRGLEIGACDFVAVVTRGHRHDALCLRTLFAGTMPGYLGLIGSRRRTAELFALFEREGIGRALLGRVLTPIGVPIGAQTPKEIAVSILAELIQHRNRQTSEKAAGSLPLTSNEPELRRYLLSGKEPCALAVVVEKSGSAPVVPGAVMAVNRLGGIVGTVGGGCGEHEVLLRALDVLQTGCAQKFTLDLTNDVAEEEGMVCGGRMAVWIEPFP